jgi:hypothetical protein
MAIREIELALQVQLYYLALISALTLPDICAALEAENGETGSDYLLTIRGFLPRIVMQFDAAWFIKERVI